MVRLEWDAKDPQYSHGLDRGVLYLGQDAVPWNGLVSVSEAATGEIQTDHYFEGRRVYISNTTGDFEASVSAFTYPEAFSEYGDIFDRSTSPRPFGLSYRTLLGDDNYRLHILYNVTTKREPNQRATITDVAEPTLFSWKLTADPVYIPDAKPASHLILESPGKDLPVLDALEEILYGTDSTDARLPDPEEIIELYHLVTTMRITHHRDGSYTATGPDSVVQSLSDGSFLIDAPTVIFRDNEVFQVSSY